MIIYSIHESKMVFSQQHHAYYKKTMINKFFLTKELAQEFIDNQKNELKLYSYTIKEVNVIEPERKCDCGKELSQHSKDIKNYNCCDCTTKKLIGNNFFDENL